MILFGTTKTGETVCVVKLDNGTLSATILTLGAILQDLRLTGVPHALTLGSDSIADYEDTMGFHGSVVGPVVNRLTDAKAPINGQTHHFETNLAKRHTLHSGSAGTHSKVWQVEEHSNDTATLTHKMPHGEGGFPGNRILTARYDLIDTTLRLTLTTTTDAPSLANVTNHSYWNLDGTDHMRDHTIEVAANDYLPSDAHFIPTGEIAPVDNTPYDLRLAKALTPAKPPLDNTFCVARARRPLTHCGTLRGASGVIMEVATTEPGFHLYDARAAQRPSRPFYEGLAIECQGWPDAPNRADFPAIEVRPDQPVVQITQWRFSKAQ